MQLRSVGLNASPVYSYHIYSRVVDKTCHLENPKFKSWMVDLLKRLSSAYAVKVYGYAMMSNHFHLVIRWTPKQAGEWSDQEVMRRWEIAHPIRNNHNDLAVDQAYIESTRAQRLSNPEWIAKAREKLSSVSFFMKDFKMAVSMHINKKTERKGTLWEGRYKLAALKDEYDLKNAMAYVDLNPFAAGVGDRPEASPHSSLHERSKQAREARKQPNATTTNPAKQRTRTQLNSWLHGYKDLISLEDYLNFVDRLARTFRKNKQHLKQGVSAILDRLEEHLQQSASQAKKQSNYKIHQALQSQLQILRPSWSRWMKWEGV